MDNEYYVDGVDGFEENEENIENISHQKELIDIVKANPILWDKKQKQYAGKNFNKDLAWAAVAEILKNISGSEAEKEFYKIRQKYGKERRKVIISLRGKSGQGAQSTYVPTWELYELCDSFLREVVKPRKTTSNYVKKIISAPTSLNKITIHPPIFKVIAPKPNPVKAPLSVITNAQIPNAKLVPNFYASLSSDDTIFNSITLEFPRISLQSPVQQTQTLFRSQTSSPSQIGPVSPSEEASTVQILRTMNQAAANTLESSRTSFQSLAQQTQAQFRSQTPSPSQIGPVSPRREANAAQILQTMNQAAAKTIPSPDTFRKKKMKMNNDLTHAFIKQSEELNNLAVQVSQALTSKQNQESIPIPAATSDPILRPVYNESKGAISRSYAYPDISPTSIDIAAKEWG